MQAAGSHGKDATGETQKETGSMNYEKREMHERERGGRGIAGLHDGVIA